MPKKYRKNKKRKMRGGALESNLSEPLTNTPSSSDENSLTNTSLDKTKSKRGASKSTYKRYNTGLFITIISAFSIIGVIWFFISRSLVRHKYSEALCYSLMAFSVVLSLILVIIAGIKTVSHMSENGMLDALKKILRVSKYVLFKSFPAQLILIQLGVLIWLCVKHASYLFSSESLPQTFTMFNIVTLIMLLGQLYVWHGEIRRLLVSKMDKRSRLIIPAFVLSAIVSGLSIGQIYVILEHLRTDC